MTYLTLENLSKAYGEKILLRNLTFSIEEGQKVAIVARNGSGKSTLLKIITNQENADSGKVIKKSGLRIGFLDQNPKFNDSHSIIDVLLHSDSELMKVVKRYEECLLNPDDMDEMQKAFEDMDRYNAWDFEANVREILDNLKLTDINKKVSELSGGQIKRLSIAKLLIDTSDLLILDEPTNHLDLQMIDWLENYLSHKSITLLMVTHDRYFLDRICDTIIELDNGNAYRYEGNYTLFLEKKSEREENELTNAIKTSNHLKSEYNWVSKMPQGRGSKSKARTENYYEEKQKNYNIKGYINERSKKIQLDIKEERLGNKILEFSNVDKKFGDKTILENFSYVFRNKEKLGIIGENGVGKSTFLNLIMQLEKPDRGYITYGDTIKFGYYSQSGINVDENKSIIDTVKDVAEYTYLSDGTKVTASQLLQRFLFHPSIQHKKVETLSGGEKRRLFLLTVILTNPNFLILDEPTNDLDLVTMGILEEFLLSFKGCVIIVSHDRFFMDLIVDHIFVFEGQGKIKDYPGNYSDYRENKDNIVLPDVEKPSEQKVITEDNSKRIREIENEISKLEKRKEKVTLKYIEVDPENYERIKQISDEVREIDKLIQDKTDEWMKLA